jgi:hypothetical protein
MSKGEDKNKRAHLGATPPPGHSPSDQLRQTQMAPPRYITHFSRGSRKGKNKDKLSRTGEYGKK